jgi:hypothetical protein
MAQETRTRTVDPAEQQTAEWNVTLRALQDLCGFERGLLYDVPKASAPKRVQGSPVFLHSSPEWQRFVAARRACDDGILTPIVSLRSLGDEERGLVVDWGSAHANAFLLVEPRESERDLVDPDDEKHRALFAAAKAAVAEGAQGARRPAYEAVVDVLRNVFGIWVLWSWTPLRRFMHIVDLPLEARGQTIAAIMLPRLHALFPQSAFDSTLHDLHEREPELFGGSVTRARMPYRTRLGLPILHDQRCPDRALRRMVNEGNARVYWYSPDHVARYGPGRPIPPDMSEE